MSKLLLCALLLAFQPVTSRPDNDFFQINHSRPIQDSHNCYPYDGKWSDRINRALSSGFPVAIEQDIAPFTDPANAQVVAKVTHREQGNAAEPTLEQYFFDRVRPIMERALKENRREQWPLIILHFDFKNNQPETLQAVWKVLEQHRDWITTGIKTDNDAALSHLDWKPLLVLTEENDVQEQIFYKKLATGDRMLIFGSAHTNQQPFQGMTAKQKSYALAHAAPDLLLNTPATNYRRWWNNSWLEVEEGGQRRAGSWTPASAERLRALVDQAHRLGYWIRFYTLDGFPRGDGQGWGEDYNFGSLAAVQARWKAAIDSGVDLIATDQYEELGAYMRDRRLGVPVPGTK